MLQDAGIDASENFESFSLFVKNFSHNCINTPPLAKIVVQTSNEKEQKIMWEKFKTSKLATKMREAKSSRAVYVTTVTLLLAVAVATTIPYRIYSMHYKRQFAAFQKMKEEA